MQKSRITRVLVGLAVGAAVAVAVPMAASAHVTVSPNQANPGSYAYVTIRVPNESDTASTVGLELDLPSDTPFTFAAYQPTPGWSAVVTTAALPEPVEVHGNTVSEAPSSITLTADAGGVGPGQFQTFQVVLGPVPDIGHVVLPAVQTYSDGTVVHWDATPEQVAADDTREPAPVLWVNDAPPTATAAVPDTLDGSESGGDGVALGLSIAALVVAAGGALFGAFALGRSRRARS